MVACGEPPDRFYCREVGPGCFKANVLAFGAMTAQCGSRCEPHLHAMLYCSRASRLRSPNGTDLSTALSHCIERSRSQPGGIALSLGGCI